MAHIEQTRAVVETTETYDGTIIPSEQAELDRPVRLNEGATVEGSVYGATVETAPDAAIGGSVMAADSIELDSTHVGQEIGTPGKVVATESSIGGTVTGSRVRLVDCIVRGNVVGANVILENCVVLGIAAAEQSLVMEDSVCYTFRSHQKTELTNTTIMLPQAIADGPLVLETPVAVAGLGRLELADDGKESAAELPTMDTADRYEQDGTTYLTLAPRILNLEKVTDRLAELGEGVMMAVDDTSGGDPKMSVKEVLSELGVSHDLVGT